MSLLAVIGLVLEEDKRTTFRAGKNKQKTVRPRLLRAPTLF